MAAKTLTHLILDQQNRVVGSVSGTDEDALAAHRGYVLRDTTRLDPLASLDVAQLARIAAADDPRMLKKGTDWIGSGTHRAQPYLSAMLGMRGVTRENIRTTPYYDDRADRVVIYFLENVGTWRGEVARAVKAALRAMVAK